MKSATRWHDVFDTDSRVHVSRTDGARSQGGTNWRNRSIVECFGENCEWV